jgi:hypothetical protein
MWCAAAVFLAACGMAGCSGTARAQITSHTIACGSTYLTTDICRPVVSGFSCDAFARALNARITQQISAAWHQARAYADDWGAQTGYHCVFHAGYDVTNTVRIISMKVTTYLDNGGTGMPQSVYYNADIAECRMLSLGDLFAADAPYQACMNAAIRKEIDKDPERYGDTFKGITDAASFFISDRQLYIAFAKYEIASGTAGEPVFAMPTEEICEYIKPEYQGLLG